MVLMVMLVVAAPGAQAIAGETVPAASASGIDAGVDAPQIATGMEPGAFSLGAAPALALLGGLLGWMSRRKLTRRGAWCRAH